MADMIEIKHLNKYFGDLHVLKISTSPSNAARSS